MTGRGQLIRVTTYNVRAFKDDNDSLAQIVRTLAPDVLLMQEAPRHPMSGHRIASFAEKVGMTWSDGRRGWMSTTLLTSLRLNVHDCVHRNLPVRKGDEPRGYCLATVSLPGHRPIHAASLHMSLRQVDRKAGGAAFVTALQPDLIPAVIGGDLNETPGHDLWTLFGQTLHEVSHDSFTFPSTVPVKRIDGLFASPTLPARTPDVPLDAALLARATDHLPVTVDLDVSSLLI
ncbi:endonuclease/exonuclease/phosphatase family protein [Calidifontibacter terrae]